MSRLRRYRSYPWQLRCRYIQPPCFEEDALGEKGPLPPSSPPPLSPQLFTAPAQGSVVSSHSTVTFAGQKVMTGLVRSTTAIIWLQRELLPHSSVAVQVRVMRTSSGQACGSSSSSNVIVTSPQLSAAVASPVLLVSVDSSHSIVMSIGQTIPGGVVSCTVTTWLMLLGIPAGNRSRSRCG